jgi:hypothetical protein
VTVTRGYWITFKRVVPLTTEGQTFCNSSENLKFYI